MAVTVNELEQAVMAVFPESKIIIKDLVGDGDHYSLEIISERFRGKSLVEQHKMVNQALKFCLGSSLHALQIKTIIP